MTHQCQACDEPAPDGVSICPRCESQTRHHLADQESHRQELVTALTRQVRMQAPNDGGRAASLVLAWARMGERYLETIERSEVERLLATLPPAKKAARMLHEQRHVLVQWCRLLKDEYRRPVPADSIAAMASHLVVHLPILRKHVAAGELVHEIRSLVRRMLAAVDYDDERPRVRVGLCPVVIPGSDEFPEEECPGEVMAHLPRDLESYLRCSACQTRWAPEQWINVGPLIQKRERKAS